MSDGKPAHSKQYYLNHHLVNKVRGPAKNQTCRHCGRPAQDWATVTGLNSEADALDPETGFIPLCRRCHRAYDQSMPDWTGRHHAPDTIEKIRQIKLGHSNHTPESRQKISQSLKGVGKSPEMREKLRQAQLRRPVVPREARHGTASEYRRGCRCDECRAAKASYRRDFRERMQRW